MMRKISGSPHEVYGDDEQHSRIARMGDTWYAWITDGESQCLWGYDYANNRILAFTTREEAETALAAELLRRSGGDA